MQLTTTLADFQMWVNKAKADKTWPVLVYHVVDTAPTEQFDTHKADFDAQMQWLSTSGITVKKVNVVNFRIGAPALNVHRLSLYIE